MTLANLNVGEFGMVLNIRHKTNLRKRLIDLGFIPGTTVTIKKIAPLGDPIEVGLRGYSLALRRAEAEMISVVRFI